MMEEGRPCVDQAQQLHAVEKAVANARREFVQGRIEHCLGDGLGTGGMTAKAALSEFKQLAKYL
jgi:DNA-binding FrmR family transcriptional regulator